MNKNKKLIKNAWKNLNSLIVALVATFLFASPAFAGNIGNSKLATGTKELFSDIGTYLLILAPIAGTVATVFFLIRRSGADEMDQKKWNNRIITAIASTVGAVIAGATISAILSYYQ